MSARRFALAIGLSLLVAACASPIRVSQVDPKAAFRAMTSSVLTDGKLSAESRTVLEEEGMVEKFEDEPVAMLKQLHEAVVSGRRGTRARFALAELSFLHAENTNDRAYYLAAAVYAWTYLFPGGGDAVLAPFDRRVRVAADLYNIALAAAFLSADGTRVELGAGVRQLPFGELEVAFDTSALRWRGRELIDLVPVATLQVVGLRARYRQDGLGAPLAASLRPIDPDRLRYDMLGPRAKIPATALLRIEGAFEQLRRPRLQGTLTVHLPSDAPAFDVDGRPVPVELEPTAVLAYSLTNSPIWEREFGGFFRSLIPQPGARSQLGALAPYHPGLIPVVFVHGTASSPARWAQMYNRLANSSRIAGKYQFWFFAYDTGAPIPYSAALLREALTEALRQFDPAGRDLALRRMVLIGHSQGGLLAKMSVIATGSRLWDGVSREPLEQLKLTDATRAELRRYLFVEPLPFVERVIFMCTPHRGSFQARNIIGELFRRIVTLPVSVTRTTTEMLKGNPDAFRVEGASATNTSLDNMNPLRPFIRALAEIPVVPGVRVNSIIAVEGDGPVAEGSDGVVTYRSAHIAPVESELVVRSSHSVQERPEAIEEVLRILDVHAGAMPPAPRR
jgi:hypothetical protein